VKVADHSDAVLDITTRDAVLKTWAGEMMIFPNIDVLSSGVTSYSELTLRRRTVYIGLGYGEEEDICVW
jgi:small-conductance mechanosensitive channel